MNEFYQENKPLLFIFTGFLIIIVVVLYFWQVQPLKMDLDSTNQTIVNLEDEKILVTTQINAYDTEDVDLDIAELLFEKKIPRERNLDDYILALQGLEFITNSKIESVTITYDSGSDHIVVEEEVEEATPEPAQEEGEEAPEDEEVEGETPVEEPVIDPVMVNEKPESLEVMVVTITAVSPNFEEFLHLIEAIENQDRVSIVSNLNFASPTENDIYTSEFEVDTKKIEFTASLTTFYYPE